jgi:hypothetical protein
VESSETSDNTKSKNISEYIKPKKLTFNDDYYELIHDYIHISDDLIFPAYNILNDVNDVKTNNYSNIFLTKKQKNSEVIKIKKNTDDNELLDITTTISFYDKSGESPDTLAIWMVVDKTFDTYEMDTTTSSFTMVKGKPAVYDNYLFRLHCIDEKYCQISHTFGDTTYYLIYDDGFKTSIMRNGIEEKSKFIYHIDGDMLQLYKIVDITTEAGTKTRLGQVVCNEYGNICDLDLDFSPFVEDENSYETNQYLNFLRRRVILINNEIENLEQPIDASWATYKRTSAIDAIDKNRTAKNLESQFLVHHEYNDGNDNINLIPLKNNLTYQGTVTNAGNLTQSTNGKLIVEPQVDLRNYTTLNTGTNQELRF